jgi:hypothetical protein
MKLYTALSVLLSRNFQLTSSLAFSAGATTRNAFARASEISSSPLSSSSPSSRLATPSESNFRHFIAPSNPRRSVSHSPLHLFPMTASSSFSSGVCTTARGGASVAGVALNQAVQAVAEDTKAGPVEIFRTDYMAPANLVTHVEMDFNIRDGKTTVTSLLTIAPNPSAQLQKDKDLILDGDETSVTLLHLSLNGKDLVEGTDYEIFPGKLVIKASSLIRPSCVLKTVVEIVPETNTQLSGLYKSGSMYCSQCEVCVYHSHDSNLFVWFLIHLQLFISIYLSFLTLFNALSLPFYVK